MPDIHRQFKQSYIYTKPPTTTVLYKYNFKYYNINNNPLPSLLYIRCQFVVKELIVYLTQDILIVRVIRFMRNHQSCIKHILHHQHVTPLASTTDASEVDQQWPTLLLNHSHPADHIQMLFAALVSYPHLQRTLWHRSRIYINFPGAHQAMSYLILLPRIYITLKKIRCKTLAMFCYVNAQKSWDEVWIMFGCKWDVNSGLLDKSCLHDPPLNPYLQPSWHFLVIENS